MIYSYEINYSNKKLIIKAQNQLDVQRSTGLFLYL